MQCIVKSSLYDFINGYTAKVDHDTGNGLLEILVDGYGRFVVDRDEVEIVSDVTATDLPF